TGSEPRGPILDGDPRSATAPARSPARAHRATSHHRAGVADGRDGPGERELLGQVLAEHLGATEQRSLLVVDRAHDADRRSPAARRAAPASISGTAFTASWSGFTPMEPDRGASDLEITRGHPGNAQPREERQRWRNTAKRTIPSEMGVAGFRQIGRASCRASVMMPGVAEPSTE